MNKPAHIMYASASNIQQLFSERYGHVSQIDFESAEEISSSIEGRLSALVGALQGDLAGSMSRSEIHKINFEDELFQTKLIVNELLNDSSIPQVSQLHGDGGELGRMYRFSCEVMLRPDEGVFDDDKKFVKVRGIEGDVEFEGTTSLDNWGSRSNVLEAIRAGKENETYPFRGILRPVSCEYRGLEVEEYRVNFLFICSPDTDSLEQWRHRQRLKDESRWEN